MLPCQQYLKQIYILIFSTFTKNSVKIFLTEKEDLEYDHSFQLLEMTRSNAVNNAFADFMTTSIAVNNAFSLNAFEHNSLTAVLHHCPNDRIAVFH